MDSRTRSRPSLARRGQRFRRARAGRAALRVGIDEEEPDRICRLVDAAVGEITFAVFLPTNCRSRCRRPLEPSRLRASASNSHPQASSASGEVDEFDASNPSSPWRSEFLAVQAATIRSTSLSRTTSSPAEAVEGMPWSMRRDPPQTSDQPRGWSPCRVDLRVMSAGDDDLRARSVPSRVRNIFICSGVVSGPRRG